MDGLAFIFALIFGLAAGAIAVYMWLNQSAGKSVQKHEAQVVLEQIRHVCKLVTVESEFSEIYNFEDKSHVFFGLIPQKKKALIVVKAKALMGIDMSKANWETDDANQKVKLSSIPEAEILSIEHDINYYDVQEGIFKKFNPSDYTELNKNALNQIKEKILQSHLPALAQKQALQVLQILQSSTQHLGWKLEYDTNVTKAIPDQKETTILTLPSAQT